MHLYTSHADIPCIKFRNTFSVETASLKNQTNHKHFAVSDTKSVCWKCESEGIYYIHAI